MNVVLMSMMLLTAILSLTSLVVEARECNTLATCWDIHGSGCGWCWDKPPGIGMNGTASGPSEGKCVEWTWEYTSCPNHIECPQLPNCRNILGTDCGWCIDGNRGAVGNSSGPFIGACNDWIWSAVECPQTPEPQQIHLAYAVDPTVMVVTWSSLNKSDSVAVYTDKKTGVTATAMGSTSEFIDTNQLGLHYIHRVNMTGLLADTEYSYAVSNDGIRSDEFSFRTLPNGHDYNATFLIYGDMGRYGGAPALSSITEEVASGGVTAIIHNGDFAYDLIDYGGLNGDDFMQRIQSVAAVVPYMTSVGNHEIQPDETFSHYRNRFSMPNSWNNNWHMWWARDIQLVHFISFSTEVNFIKDKQWVAIQDAWLEQDLIAANKNRANVPWIVAFAHRPAYCSNSDGDDCTYDKSITRLHFEDLFYRYGVELTFWAHEHSYERTWPVYNLSVTQYDYVEPQAPIHIITGAAGCNEDDGDCLNPIPKARGVWSAFHASGKSAYGYGHLRVINHTHMHWDEVTTDNGRIIDTITVVKTKHGPFKQNKRTAEA